MMIFSFSTKAGQNLRTKSYLSKSIAEFLVLINLVGKNRMINSTLSYRVILKLSNNDSSGAYTFEY